MNAHRPGRRIAALPVCDPMAATSRWTRWFQSRRRTAASTRAQREPRVPAGTRALPAPRHRSSPTHRPPERALVGVERAATHSSSCSARGREGGASMGTAPPPPPRLGSACLPCAARRASLARAPRVDMASEEETGGRGPGKARDVAPALLSGYVRVNSGRDGIVHDLCEWPERPRARGSDRGAGRRGPEPARTQRREAHPGRGEGVRGRGRERRSGDVEGKQVYWGDGREKRGRRREGARRGIFAPKPRSVRSPPSSPTRRLDQERCTNSGSLV